MRVNLSVPQINQIKHKICASQTLSSSMLKLWSQASLPTGRQCVRPTIRLFTFNTALISAMVKTNKQFFFFQTANPLKATLYHQRSLNSRNNNTKKVRKAVLSYVPNEVIPLKLISLCLDVVLISAIPTGQFVGFGHLAIGAACGQASPHSQGLCFRGAAGGGGSTGHATAAWHRF